MKHHSLLLMMIGLAFAGDASLAARTPVLSINRLPVSLLANGKKEDKGEKIELDKLPKAVVESVKKEMPGARLTLAYKKVVDGKTTYLLDDVKVGKKEWDVTVAEDGTILKKEESHDED